MHLNAHCHLELSYMKGLIPAGLPFAEWLARLVELREKTPPEEKKAAVREAVDRMVKTKTSVLLDIVSRDDVSEQALRNESAIRSMLFHEIIHFNPEEGKRAVDSAVDRQAARGGLPLGMAHGLSPHAVYTTSGPLLQEAAERARSLGQWLCIHAAETPEETEFALAGKGPLRDLLNDFLPPGWEPPGMRPMPWLDIHECLGPRTLLVHCNEINDTELHFIARRGASVVVCPGSHVYFQRGAFPLKRLLDAGIPTFLGTDSLASNEDLDMEREITIAKELCPELPIERIRVLTGLARAERFFQ